MKGLKTVLLVAVVLLLPLGCSEMKHTGGMDHDVDVKGNATITQKFEAEIKICDPLKNYKDDYKECAMRAMDVIEKALEKCSVPVIE